MTRATAVMLGEADRGDRKGQHLVVTTAAAKAGPVSMRTFAGIAFVFVLFALAPPAAAQTKAKNVLVLSGGRGRVSINQMQSTLRTRFPGPVNFSIVDLENPRFEQEAYQEHLAEALRSGYADEQLDLVIAVMTPSLEFAVRYRDTVFPGVPIVFMSISTPLPEKMWPGVTGVESPLGVPEIIDLALRLHPDTEAIAVISNVTGVDNDWLFAERAALLRYRDKVKEIDLVGPPSPELLQKVAALPPHTVVLFQLFPQDRPTGIRSFRCPGGGRTAPAHVFHPAPSGPRSHWRGNLRRHERCRPGGTARSTSALWRAGRPHSRCAELPRSGVSGLATASPVEHSGVGIAVWHSGLESGTDPLAALLEIHHRGQCRDGRPMFIDSWIVVAARAKTEGGSRHSRKRTAFPSGHQHGAGDDLDVRPRSIAHLFQPAVAGFHGAVA